MKLQSISLSICILFFALLLVVTATRGWAIDEDSIVGVWLFDEGTGRITHDLSGNNNDAVFEGEPEWVNGKFGKALNFDGSEDYLAAPDSDSLDVSEDQLSIIAWVNGEGWPAANHIVRKIADEEAGAIYMLRVHPEIPYVILSAGGADKIIQGPTTLPTEEWIHLAMVYDGQEVRIYVNGELDVAAPLSGELAQSDNELRIGRGDPAGYFLGIIDDVGVFASALTEEDIQEIMEIGLQEVLGAPVEPVGKLPTSWAKIKTAY